jgi:transposase-like protein
MLFESINQLLEPGYSQMETGYCRLPDGSMFVAVLTDMIGCKSRWLQWYFRHNMLTNKNSPKHSLHQGLFVLDKQVFENKFIPVEPTTLFEPSRLKASGVLVFVCGNSYFRDGTLASHAVRLVRNTMFGCEMRSRFWLYKCSEEKARIRMEHCIFDMVSLAYSLRIEIENFKSNNPLYNTICKNCYSDDVVKSGQRKGGQYWLCKSCGHHFINNSALARMQYPLNIMTRAVNDYTSGKSLNNIREELLKEFDSAPSTSTIHGWIHKLTQLASK